MFADRDGPVRPLSVHVTPVALSTNQNVVSAVTGKHIIVLNGQLSSSGGATYVNFKAGSGGAILRAAQVPANTVATPNVDILGHMWGAFIVPVSTALVVDIGAVRADVSITYVLFRP